MQPLIPTIHARHWTFLRSIAEACAREGGRAFLVGGCVRSALMGEPPVDFDIEVFNLSPGALEAALQGLAPVIRVGRAFGIYKLAGWPVDIGLPRRERKTGPGHCGFEVRTDPSMSLAEAARRRDFTLNAIYFNLLEERLEDPLGGFDDLEKGILRHCSDRFPEDPLRVLRAMQFAARIPASVASETVAMCRNLTPEGLSPERFFAEWEKLLLKGKRPSRGLAFLKASGWLRYFPELEALSGCPQDPEWHPEGDVWEHTLHCMDAFAKRRSGRRDDDLVTGFAVLCHDMGKPATTEFIDGRFRSYGHEAAGIKPAQSFLQRLNVSQRLIDRTLPLIKCHMRPSVLYRKGCSPSALRRLARDCGRLDLLVRVFQADSAGRPPLPDDSPEAAEWLLGQARRLDIESQKPRPLLNGHDLMERGWEAGPEMGRFLARAYEQQLDGCFSTRGEALAWLDRQLSGNGRSPENQSNP
ncbi:MAG: HD domain-containing protein [Oceanipulchritudo sp.]